MSHFIGFCCNFPNIVKLFIKGRGQAYNSTGHITHAWQQLQHQISEGTHDYFDFPIFHFNYVVLDYKTDLLFSKELIMITKITLAITTVLG